MGVTNDLHKRIWEHKHGTIPGFANRYRITNLVYFEQACDAGAAIAREKQLKRWSRRRKLRLIETHNAGWLDLSLDWFGRAGKD